jgi:hypothetical protein
MDTCSHITLCSNGSMDMYPDNKQSNFTNHLDVPIRLDPHKRYEVALTSFNYPTGHKMVINPFKITVRYKFVYKEMLEQEKLGIIGPLDVLESYSFEAKEKVYVGSIEELVKYITRGLRDALTNFIRYDVPDNLKRVFNKYQNKLEVDCEYNVREYKDTVLFSLREADDGPTFKMNPTLTFSGSEDVLKVLGLDKKLDEKIDLPFSSEHMPNLLMYNAYLYIYTDIVEQSRVGGKMVQNLDHVPINLTREMHLHHQPIYSPKYHRITKPYIPSITLWCANESGELIGFRQGITTFNLHIRPCETTI